MRSRTSPQDVIASKWWEAEACRILITTSSRNIETISSLIPFTDETTLLGQLIGRSDLDMLFILHCRQNLSGQQIEDSELTDNFKARELWRVLRFPSGQCCPWDWNWQPPLSGDPREIAGGFHAAVFRVPLFDFVKYAVGYYSKAHLVGSLLTAACNVRDSLRRAFQDRPETKDTYIEVEKILRSQYDRLTYWIVASSLDNPPYPLHVALASILDPVKNLFATRKLEFVLTRLAVLDRCFNYINQKYRWDRWSSDPGFWTFVYDALWSGHVALPLAILSMPPHLPPEDREERLCFIQGFESTAEDEVDRTSRKNGFFRRTFLKIRQWIAGRRSPHHNIEPGLPTPRILEQRRRL